MKIVEVLWADSTSSGGWDGATDLATSLCKTVGYLTVRNKNRVVVVQSTSDGGNCDNRFAIPRGCIKSIRELK